jgi:hypothetical protein
MDRDSCYAVGAKKREFRDALITSSGQGADVYVSNALWCFECGPCPLRWTHQILSRGSYRITDSSDA